MHNSILAVSVTDRPILTAKRIRQSKKECGVLYKLVRHKLGLTQRQFAKVLGISYAALFNRENRKRVYTVGEILALQRISGIEPNEFWQILEAVAK